METDDLLEHTIGLFKGDYAEHRPELFLLAAGDEAAAAKVEAMWEGARHLLLALADRDMDPLVKSIVVAEFLESYSLSILDAAQTPTPDDKDA